MEPSRLETLFRYYAALGFERLAVRLPERKGRGRRRGKELSLDELRRRIGDCRRCRLSEKRKRLVFGEGDPDARLLFVGEAPGEEEDRQGRPFVGKAGELLNRLIEKMGFKREEVYIANTVKCRPPGNRKPLEDEIRTCMPFLERQIEIIAPAVIMTLGDVATRALLGDVGSISRVRGKTFSYRGIPLVPTFHPSYLLRNPKSKWLTWSDAQVVLGLLSGKRGG